MRVQSIDDINLNHAHIGLYVHTTSVQRLGEGGDTTYS